MFSLFLPSSVILNQTTINTQFCSSASVLILKEIDRSVFEKYCSLCKLEGFCKLDIYV